MLQRLLKNDKAALHDFVKSKQQIVYLAIVNIVKNKEEAEDLTQETFITAIERLNQFQGNASLQTWLIRIAINKALDFKRKKQISTVQVADIQDKIASEADPLKALLVSENKQQVHYMINRLKPNYQEVIKAYYLKDMSYQEIADIEGVELKTVESRLYRAKKQLQQLTREVN